MPPVEEWLEIRKIVSVKKKRAPDAGSGQTAIATAPTQAQAKPNTPTGGVQKNSPKTVTKNAPKIPLASSAPEQPAATPVPAPPKKSGVPEDIDLT